MTIRPVHILDPDGNAVAKLWPRPVTGGVSVDYSPLRQNPELRQQQPTLAKNDAQHDHKSFVVEDHDIADLAAVLTEKARRDWTIYNVIKRAGALPEPQGHVMASDVGAADSIRIQEIRKRYRRARATVAQAKMTHARRQTRLRQIKVQEQVEIERVLARESADLSS